MSAFFNGLLAARILAEKGGADLVSVRDDRSKIERALNDKILGDLGVTERDKAANIDQREALASTLFGNVVSGGTLVQPKFDAATAAVGVEGDEKTTLQTVAGIGEAAFKEQLIKRMGTPPQAIQQMIDASS